MESQVKHRLGRTLQIGKKLSFTFIKVKFT